MKAKLGVPIELTAINRKAAAHWREKWRVEQGHGEECTHSTTHVDLADALAMVRILAAQQDVTASSGE